MDIAEKTLQLKKDFDEVLNAGKKSQYDEFWDNYQDIDENGIARRKFYRCAFFGTTDRKYKWGWNDTTYNPKCPIEIDDANGAYQTFNYNTNITSTKVPIILSFDGKANSFCSRCYNLRIIPLLVINGDIDLSETFSMCGNLTDITIEGEQTQNISFSDSPLSTASIVSIVEHLSGTTSGKTLTLNKTAVNTAFGINVDDESTYPEGSEYYILRHSKDNWTFTYA